jgi:hypothetical protein
VGLRGSLARSDIMLSQLSHEDSRRVLEAAANSRAALPPSTDRDAWDAARQHLASSVLTRLIASAEEAARTAIPPLTATMYLDCLRTGQRESWASLTAGECLEGRGRFLDAVLDLAWRYTRA